jgi:DNA-binding response OmpR family regulator
MVKGAGTPPRTKCRVLLVEDDESTLSMFAEALRMEGFYVRTAQDGLAALRILEAYDPDVVILDLKLPIASGFDVLLELRTSGVQMPVIAVSGHERGLERARSNADFFAALSKPCDPNDLITVTKRAFLQAH